jgi:hypothetical protein
LFRLLAAAFTCSSITGTSLPGSNPKTSWIMMAGITCPPWVAVIGDTSAAALNQLRSPEGTMPSGCLLTTLSTGGNP